MSNALAASVSVAVPQYVADGYTGSGNTRQLTFSGGAPPTDGSIGLCFVIINVSTGIAYVGGAYQRLLYWADTVVGKAQVTGSSDFDLVSVPQWSFVADANAST
jgi:hypothetical protein